MMMLMQMAGMKPGDKPGPPGPGQGNTPGQSTAGGNTDKLKVLHPQLKRLDIPLLPPDVNRSGVEFIVETIRNGTDWGAIRYALAAIKNVGRQAMADVVADREKNGPFADEFDFAARLGGKTTNKCQFENLVRAGALDARPCRAAEEDRDRRKPCRREWYGGRRP